MSKLDELSKFRELIRLEGIILALKNQMETTYEEVEKFRDNEECNYNKASDSEKEVMDRIDDRLEEIDHIWNYKIC